MSKEFNASFNRFSEIPCENNGEFRSWEFISLRICWPGSISSEFRGTAPPDEVTETLRQTRTKLPFSERGVRCFSLAARLLHIALKPCADICSIRQRSWQRFSRSSLVEIVDLIKFRCNMYSRTYRHACWVSWLALCQSFFVSGYRSWPICGCHPSSSRRMMSSSCRRSPILDGKEDSRMT